MTEDKQVFRDKATEFMKTSNGFTKTAEVKFGLRTEGKPLYALKPLTEGYLAIPNKVLLDELEELETIHNAHVEIIVQKIKDEPEKKIALTLVKQLDNQNFYQDVPGRKSYVSTKGVLMFNKHPKEFNKFKQTFEAYGTPLNLYTSSYNAVKSRTDFFNYLKSLGLSGVTYETRDNKEVVVMFSNTSPIENKQASEITLGEVQPSADKDFHPFMHEVGYDIQDMKKALEHFTYQELSKMLRENTVKAKATIDEVLYSEDEQNSIFVSNKEVNINNNKCK